MALKISKVDIMLLSILVERPMYGYEIQQALEARHMRKWVAMGASSVYAGLERLQRKGFAVSELDTSQGLPARKVFSITEKGTDFFKQEAKNYLANGEYLYPDVNVGMVAIPHLERSEVRELLQHRKTEMLEMLQDAEEHNPHNRLGTPEHAIMLWEHTYQLLKAEIAWLDFVLRRLK